MELATERRIAPCQMGCAAPVSRLGQAMKEWKTGGMAQSWSRPERPWAANRPTWRVRFGSKGEAPSGLERQSPVVLQHNEEDEEAERRPQPRPTTSWEG